MINTFDQSWEAKLFDLLWCDFDVVESASAGKKIEAF